MRSTTKLCVAIIAALLFGYTFFDLPKFVCTKPTGGWAIMHAAARRDDRVVSGRRQRA